MRVRIVWERELENNKWKQIHSEEVNPRGIETYFDASDISASKLYKWFIGGNAIAENKEDKQ